MSLITKSKEILQKIESYNQKVNLVDAKVIRLENIFPKPVSHTKLKKKKKKQEEEAEMQAGRERESLALFFLKNKSGVVLRPFHYKCWVHQ